MSFFKYSVDHWILNIFAVFTVCFYGIDSTIHHHHFACPILYSLPLRDLFGSIWSSIPLTSLQCTKEKWYKGHQAETQSCSPATSYQQNNFLCMQFCLRLCNQILLFSLFPCSILEQVETQILILVPQNSSWIIIDKFRLYVYFSFLEAWYLMYGWIA